MRTTVLLVTTILPRAKQLSRVCHRPGSYALEAASGLDLNVLAEAGEHRGNRPFIVGVPGVNAETLAIVPDSDFGDGAID